MLITVEGQSRVADAISIGARSRVSVKSPVTLTLSTRSHAFQGKVSNGEPQFVPALLTRICSASVRLRVSAARAATPASVATVPPKPSQGPSDESSCAAASQASALREAISTRAPALSSASAQIRPSPVAPPVTSAVRPRTEKSSFAAIMAPRAASRFARDHSNSATNAKPALLAQSLRRLRARLTGDGATLRLSA